MYEIEIFRGSGNISGRGRNEWKLFVVRPLYSHPCSLLPCTFFRLLNPFRRLVGLVASASAGNDVNDTRLNACWTGSARIRAPRPLESKSSKRNENAQKTRARLVIRVFFFPSFLLFFFLFLNTTLVVNFLIFVFVFSIFFSLSLSFVRFQSVFLSMKQIRNEATSMKVKGNDGERY